MKAKSRKTAGSVLWIVLICIALFAALIFVMTRSNKYDTGSSEKAALDAQQITSYADKINGTVQTLMSQNHCLASQISFANPTMSGYTNGANPLCQVFAQTGGGGGMSFQTPPAEAVDNAAATAASSTLAGNYIFEGNVCVTNAGTSCTSGGTALVFFMPWVTEEVCAQINQITSNSTTIPTVADPAFNGTKFTGTFAGTYTITTSGTTNTSGCFHTTTTPGTGYHYYSVLVAN